MSSVSQIVFKKYDEDGNGISTSEFRNLCYDLGHYLSEDELNMAIKFLDADGSGKIEYNEFQKWWRESNKWSKLELSDDQIRVLNQAATYFGYFDKVI